MTGGGPSPGSLCGGSSASGIARPPGQRAEPGARPACGWPGRGTPAARAAPLGRPGRPATAADDRGVRQHPAGGDVAAAGQLVPGLPQRAHACPAAGGRAPGACPTSAARGRPAAPAGRRRGSPRTPAAPTPACPAASRLVRQRVPQLDQHLDVQRGVAQPASGSGRVDQSAAEWPFSSASPSTLDDRRPGRPARSRPAGRPARCRTACVGAHADLGQARQVLAGGVQHPLGVAHGRPARRERSGSGDRVDEHRCRRRRGAAAPGRRAARSGSRRRARRPRRPGRCRRPARRRRRPARWTVSMTGGSPSRGASSGTAVGASSTVGVHGLGQPGPARVPARAPAGAAAWLNSTRGHGRSLLGAQWMTPARMRQGDHVGPVAGAQLARDAGQVALHGQGGQAQRLADLLVRVPVGDQPQDLELAGGQLPDSFLHPVLGQPLGQAAGDAGVGEHLAGHRRPQPLGEGGQRAGLQHVPLYPGQERRPDDGRVGDRGEHDGHRPALGAQRRQQLQATPVVHRRGCRRPGRPRAGRPPARTAPAGRRRAPGPGPPPARRPPRRPGRRGRAAGRRGPGGAAGRGRRPARRRAGRTARRRTTGDPATSPSPVVGPVDGGAVTDHPPIGVRHSAYEALRRVEYGGESSAAVRRSARSS